MFIIIDAIGVSSNGRTRDFGSLYHGSNPCAPTKIKQCPQGAFFILLFVTYCTISYSDCTAKHYQCFVSVSENCKFPKTLVGNIPTPLCAPQPRFKRPFWGVLRLRIVTVRNLQHRICIFFWGGTILQNACSGF